MQKFVLKNYFKQRNMCALLKQSICSCVVLFSIFGCRVCVCDLKRLKFSLRNLQLRFKLLRFWLRNLRLRFTTCFLNAQLWRRGTKQSLATHPSCTQSGSRHMVLVQAQGQTTVSTTHALAFQSDRVSSVYPIRQQVMAS